MLASRSSPQELKKKFEVFFLFVREGSYRSEDHLPAWQNLFGERAMVLDDANAVCETIALTIGLMEGVTLSEGVKQIQGLTGDQKAAAAAGKALAGVAGL